MTRRIQTAALVFIGLIYSSTASLAQNLGWSTWKNENTSLLLITKVETGKITGTFINNHPEFPACTGIAVPVRGTISGNDLVLVANFASCSNTMTVWKGMLSGNGENIPMSWILHYVDQNGNFAELRGSNTFTKVH